MNWRCGEKIVALQFRTNTLHSHFQSRFHNNFLFWNKETRVNDIPEKKNFIWKHEMKWRSGCQNMTTAEMLIHSFRSRLDAVFSVTGAALCVGKHTELRNLPTIVLIVYQNTVGRQQNSCWHQISLITWPEWGELTDKTKSKKQLLENPSGLNPKLTGKLIMFMKEEELVCRLQLFITQLTAAAPSCCISPYIISNWPAVKEWQKWPLFCFVDVFLMRVMSVNSLRNWIFCDTIKSTHVSPVPCF